jgi:hypothetical protein
MCCGTVGDIKNASAKKKEKKEEVPEMPVEVTGDEEMAP